MINAPNITTADCVNTAPAPDERCADEAFRLANPEACPPQPSLAIKPAIALTCNLSSTQFRAFYRDQGNEIDVTTDAIWTSSDSNVVLIGAVSGNATALSQGDVTITATYQGIMAHATLTVLGTGCCDTKHVAIEVVIDNSRSMSQSFSSNYSTKLIYAKAAATQFIGEINETKDTVGAIKFNDAEDVILHSISADKAAVANKVATISQTQQKTSFYDVLYTAVQELATSTADLKVILLMSDGEDSVNSSYTDENNPIVLMSDFKSQGGIVICLGTRASGKGFNLLSSLSTGGFFINASASTEQVSLDYLSGLKGYICAGNCTPEGDISVGQGALSYDQFINWDVFDGTVDLQGNGFFDVIPDHGLYVGLGGTDPVTNGRMQLKTPIALTTDHVYTLSMDVAGNHQMDVGPQGFTMGVFYLDDSNVKQYFLVASVSLNFYTAAFEKYSFSFNALNDANCYIELYQSTPVGANSGVGLLIDNVQLKDTTDLITLFSDDFDDENSTFVSPRCGPGSTYAYIPSLGAYGYGYGYSCYGEGCLDEPPVAQLPDPFPLANIEAGFQPPRIFTSTQTSCASCPEGFINLDGPDQVCKSATESSDVSQADAVAQAQASALALAQAELNCVRQYTSTQHYTATCAFGLFPQTANGTATSLVSQEDADSQALSIAIANAMALLDCSNSNNTQAIVFNNGVFAKATPYPSYQFISGMTGTITNATVTLSNVFRQSPEPMALLLTSPSGRKVLLMYFAAAASQRAMLGIGITFDDAAPTEIPATGSGIIPGGSYKPTIQGSPLAFPSPAPGLPYDVTLASLIGDEPNGQWVLWAIHLSTVTFAYPNEIAFGWSMGLTTA